MAVGPIRAAGIELKDIGAIVVNTITGVAIPSLDAKLMNRLDLPASVVSAALFGDGAAGVVLRNTKGARPIAGGRGQILAARNTEHIIRVGTSGMTAPHLMAAFGHGFSAYFLTVDL